jgi:hypothetical protein
MRDAAWIPARKSGRRLMVLMIPATVPLGLTALACAYTSAKGPFASDSSTILIRATTLLTASGGKSVGFLTGRQRGAHVRAEIRL